MRLGLSVHRLSAALLTLAASALIPLAASQAYVGQNPYIVTFDGPGGTVRCDATAQITATIRSSETGVLVPGQVVHWDFSTERSTADTVSPARTITNQNGQATVRVDFGPAEGKRVVRAMIIREFPEYINVSCAGGVPATPTPTRPPTRTPTAPAATGRPDNPDRTPNAPDATPTTDPNATPAGPVDGGPTAVPVGSPLVPGTIAPQASVPPVAVATTGTGGGGGGTGTGSPTPGEGATAAPGTDGGTGNPSTPPSGGGPITLLPDRSGAAMTLLAALAVLGAGLAVVGVVLVRRR